MKWLNVVLSAPRPAQLDKKFSAFFEKIMKALRSIGNGAYSLTDEAGDPETLNTGSWPGDRTG